MRKFVEFTIKKQSSVGDKAVKKIFINLERISSIYTEGRNYTLIELDNGKVYTVTQTIQEVLKRIGNDRRKRTVSK